MQNVRVVQRNLVYVVGLALELCHEDLLKTDKYFGQFGKIIKVNPWLIFLHLMHLQALYKPD